MCLVDLSVILGVMRFLHGIVSPSYLFTLVDIKKRFISGFRQEYYSQSGEDIIVGKLLPKENGFYVDVGAFHPQHYSNTHLLYRKGWTGINIDPNSASIELFKRRRKRDVNLQLGILDDRKELPYYQFSHASCNTFSQEQAENMKRETWIDFLNVTNVKCVPLRDVLETYLPDDIAIDLLNVDVEGMDEQVLRSNDWGRYRPRVIIVESHGFNAESPENDHVYRFLKSKSYLLHAFTGLSLIFVADNYARNK